MNRSQRVDIHIEELVVHGMNAHDAKAVAAAIEREIVRALGGRQIDLAEDRLIDRLATRDVAITTGGTPARIAAEVARSVSGAVGVAPARGTSTVHSPAAKR